MSQMYDRVKFGEKLSELRKKRWEQYIAYQDKTTNPYKQFAYCKSQDSFASEFGYERRTIGKWELGTAIPSFDDVLRICELLECNMDYLLGREELTGFSTTAIASHYSRIDKTIIEHAQKDDDYLDFLNYFMNPSKCYDLVNSISLSEWKAFLSTTTLEEISGTLKSTIENIYQQYLAFTPINRYNKDSFKDFVFSRIKNDSITFVSRKLDDKICIPACISKTKYAVLGFSNNDTENYNILINYLADYCFEILFNKTMLEIQKDRIGKTFTHMIEEYYSE